MINIRTNPDTTSSDVYKQRGWKRSDPIPEYEVFYKEVGSIRIFSPVILDVSETPFSDLWGFRIYGDFEEILK